MNPMNLNLGAAIKYGLGFNGLLGIAVALYLGSSIFVPIVISALLATILYPLAKRLSHSLHLPWFFACLTTIILTVLISAFVFSIIGTAVVQLVYQLPQDEQAWRKQYDETVKRLRKDMPFLTDDVLPTTTMEVPPSKDAPFGIAINPKGENAFRAIQKAFSVDSLTPVLLKMAGYSAEQFGQLVLILFVTLFLLLEAELLAHKIGGIFGTTSENKKKVTEALTEMAEAVRTYLVWRTMVNMGLAIVLGAFYRYALNLEHYALWAVLTAILSYVPYVGTILAALPPILDALVFNANPAATAVGIVLFYTAVVTIEGYVIVPWVMGRSMDLNATTVMISCLLWTQLWGVAGLFLAMPLMAAIKAVMLVVDGWRPWGELLSSVETTPAASVEAAPAVALPPRGDDATVVMDAPPVRESPKDPV